MCVTDRNDMILGVKLALNPNATNKPSNVKATENTAKSKDEIRLCGTTYELSVPIVCSKHC